MFPIEFMLSQSCYDKFYGIQQTEMGPMMGRLLMGNVYGDFL